MRSTQESAYFARCGLLVERFGEDFLPVDVALPLDPAIDVILD